MLVKDYMTRHPFMIEPDMPVVDAQRYLAEVNVGHLPVTGSGKRLLGLITRRTLSIQTDSLDSLNVWEITRYISGLTVKKLMIKKSNMITIDPNATIEDAAYSMVKHKIGCLPVIEKDIIVGLLTSDDLLAHLTQLFATEDTGIRISIRMPDHEGELSKLICAFTAKGWGIISCGGLPSPKSSGDWDAVIKIQDEVVEEEVKKTVATVKGHKILDIRKI